MRNYYLFLLSTAWKYARAERKRFVLVYSLFAVSILIVAINPLFYGWFVGQLQQHGAAVMNVTWLYVLGFLGLKLLEWSFHGPARVMERKLAFKISRNFLEGLYEHVLHLPVQWHQENHSGSTISKLRKGYESLRDFFQNGFIYLYSFGKFVFSFSAMLYYSPLFGSIGIALGVVTILIIVRFDKPYIRALREVNTREHDVSSTLFDTLSNIATVITLRLEQRIHHSFVKRVGAVFKPFKKQVTINEWKWFTAQMMVGLIYAVTVFGYVQQHWVPGQIFQIGGLIILIGYVNQFTSVFNDIASQYTQIVRYHTDIQHACEIQKAQESSLARNGVPSLPSLWQHIDIRHLNFVREDKHATGIADVAIRIRRGQRIAFIGESGSGKSTLLSLLRGLHRPAPGTVVMINDNIPCAFESIGSTVTLFPQEPEIFESTILYNITLGLPFTDDEVMKVCEDVQFADVVRQLPRGLATHIQEKGVNLSGGQKQRLALARGVLAARSSEIVLMDEPTSSVDPRTEKLIYNNLFKAFREKAIVSSLHRLHLLPEFDYVYILQKGIIADHGTFHELRHFSLLFKDMWEHQEINTGKDTSAAEQFPKLNVAR